MHEPVREQRSGELENCPAKSESNCSKKRPRKQLGTVATNTIVSFDGHGRSPSRQQRRWRQIGRTDPLITSLFIASRQLTHIHTRDHFLHRRIQMSRIKRLRCGLSRVLHSPPVFFSPSVYIHISLSLLLVYIH